MNPPVPLASRLNPRAAAPQAVHALATLEAAVVDFGLEPSLFHLVKTRASQLNGCAYCVHLHTREARKDGETEERLYLLSAWRESPLYTARERAALGWTDALTLIADTNAPDETYAALAAQFSAEEQVKLTVLIGAINAWNRLAIGFRMVHPVSHAPGGGR